MNKLDIIIPVYNEGENILETLRAIKEKAKNPLRILICYDFDEDNTLPAIDKNRSEFNFQILFVKNKDRGPHQAVVTGFEASEAEAILVFPAD